MIRCLWIEIQSNSDATIAMMGAYFFAKRLFTYAFVRSGATVKVPGSLAEHLWPWVGFFLIITQPCLEISFTASQ